MKLLIAVKSCQHHMDRGDHDVIRNTWGREVKNADLRFFFGGSIESNLYKEDEIPVDAPDDYESLSLKTIAIVDWAQKQNYDFVYLCDTDTYVISWRLEMLGFENFDFCGLATKEFGQQFPYRGRTRGGVDFTIPNAWGWCSGGFGYFLSRKAMEAILMVVPPTDPVMVWCEDMWVGQVIGPLHACGQLKAAHLANFANQTSWHFPQSAYNDQYHPKYGWQEKMFREHR